MVVTHFYAYVYVMLYTDCIIPHRNRREQHARHWREFSGNPPTLSCTDSPCTECVGFCREPATCGTWQEQNWLGVECAGRQRLTPTAHQNAHNSIT